MITVIKTQLGWMIGKVTEKPPKPTPDPPGIKEPLILEDPAEMNLLTIPVPGTLHGQQQRLMTTYLIVILPFRELCLRTEGPFAATDLSNKDPLYELYHKALLDYKKIQKREVFSNA